MHFSTVKFYYKTSSKDNVDLNTQHKLLAIILEKLILSVKSYVWGIEIHMPCSSRTVISNPVTDV